MKRIELDWDDMKDIAAEHIAPAAAQLLDALDGDQLEDVVLIAAGIRDAAQAVVAGRV